ncbi:hypothetical protein SGRA_3342 [Saprospira grandis str. Lewin]|uniref:Uncharacterized protein n=1 Tax=Saprospira grandis (strain Lewin) TaxID=984262 RepID=H6L133_SAPGL|nr:hypothetical protein SGRA_3342 [Saprospira grandis str. Lewin]
MFFGAAPAAYGLGSGSVVARYSLGPAVFFASLQKTWVWPSATTIHPSAVLAFGQIGPF